MIVLQALLWHFGNNVEEVPDMARITKLVSVLMLLVVSLCLVSTVVSADVLVLFDSYGLLYKSVVDGDVVPSNWSALQISAQKWYLETLVTDSKYQLPTQLPEGVYQLKGNTLISENGEIYANTSFGLAKVIQTGETQKVLRVSEKADALFQVPGGYRIYYTLKGNQLEQFFELNSPVDKAYVILSTAPGGEGRAVNYAKTVMADFSAQEVTTGGRKIFVLGDLEGLRSGINVRNKSIPIVRKDWNLISLDYSYTYSWQPADYVVDIQCNDELPAGNVFVFSDISGYTVPIGTAYMPDINKEGELFVSKSWEVYHNWNLTKSTKLSGKVYITGELNLRGYGPTKIVIRANNISGLSISSGTIKKQTADYAEIEFNLSGTAQIKISFNYVG